MSIAGPANAPWRPIGRLSLRARLVALTIVSIVPLLIFAMAVQYLNYRRDREAAGQQVLAMARGAVLVVERELEMRITALRVLALSGVLQAGDLAAFRRRAEALVDQHFPGTNILLMDREGQHLLNLALPPGAPLPRRQQLDTLRQVLATGGPAVSSLFQGRVLDRPIIAIDVPVKDADGAVRYILTMNPPLNVFTEVIREQRSPPGWVFSVFDRVGTNVARTPNPELFVGKKASATLLPVLLRDAEGVVETVSLEGIPLLSAFSHARASGWSVAIGMPLSELVAPALRSMMQTLAVGAGLLLVGLAVALAVARQITGPIAVLRRIALAAGKDATPEPAVTGLPETDQVAQALREAERNRRRSEGQLHLFIEFAPAAIAMVDTSLRYLAVSRRFQEDYRLTDQALIGNSLFDTFPEMPGRWRGVLDRCLAGGTERGNEEQLKRSDGSVDWIRWEIRPWFDGETVGGLVIFNEVITEQKLAQDQLRQAQKLEAVGQLTGGIAHDFNNILTVISGTAELMAEESQGRARSLQYAKTIETATERGAALTRHLLAFARRQPLQPAVTDLNALVRDAARLFKPALGEQVEIVAALRQDVAPALVDPSQLSSALLNLAINARDAMPEGGKLTLETANATLDADYAALNPDVTPGEYAMVAVSDTGSGIPEAIREKVFEPFFTTKEVGKGTGLGLSMVYGFVKQSGGHIKIYSEEALGTSIKLYLPRSTAAAEGTLAPVETAAPADGETVLVVEDDDMVRRHAVTLLESLGYRTLEVPNGPRALQLVDAGQPFDVLFTDVIMPGGLNGRQLAEEVRKRRPGMRVLYTSGYTEDAILHHGRLDPGVTLLNKPYRKVDLARKLREVLAAPPQG